MFEIREITEKSEYNPLLISETAPFTQAWFFGEWQEKMGRKVKRFAIFENSEIIGFFQAIKYPLLFSNNILYIPHGPVTACDTQHATHNNEFFKIFNDKLLKISKEENAIFTRFDIFPPSKINLGEKVPEYGYKASYFQPKHEWILDLNKTEEELWNGVHPKNQYNINLAKKRNVSIEIENSDFKKYFETFFGLIGETAKRNKFHLHPKIYYRNIFETLNKSNAFIVTAKLENKILAMNLVLTYGKTAYFLFGGSSGEYKNLMFSHLAQWGTIREANKRGFAVYNFGGVDVDGKGNLAGVSFFKKRFGGRIFEYSDSYDIVSSNFWRTIYNLKKKFWK